MHPLPQNSANARHATKAAPAREHALGKDSAARAPVSPQPLRPPITQHQTPRPYFGSGRRDLNPAARDAPFRALSPRLLHQRSQVPRSQARSSSQRSSLLTCASAPQSPFAQTIVSYSSVCNPFLRPFLSTRSGLIPAPCIVVVLLSRARALRVPDAPLVFAGRQNRSLPLRAQKPGPTRKKHFLDFGSGRPTR